MYLSIKATLRKYIDEIILNWDKLRAFYLRSRTEEGHSVFPNPFGRVLIDLAIVLARKIYEMYHNMKEISQIIQIYRWHDD